MPKIPYTKIYMSDWIAWRRKLPPETLCEILDTIADYCTFGEKPEVKPEDNPRVIEVLTTLMKWTTDCEKAYQSNLEKGKKGGRPKSGAKKPEVKPEQNLGAKQPEPELKTNTDKLLNSLFSDNKNKLVISDSFVIPVDEEPFSMYSKELGTDIIKQVERWLIKNKQGTTVDKQFICKQFMNFAQRQGINILDIVKNGKNSQK